MSAPLLRGRARVRQQVVGLIFLVVIGGLVALTIALYQKAFTPVTTVLVRADRAGNQLTAGGDVKARGLLVGEIRSVSSTGEGAELELAIDRDQAALLPSDLTVQLLPKTLFGEKFVSLELDSASTARPLREGDVISQDRSVTARETSQALDNLLPLLQTLQPQQLSITLNAVSSALRGRGDTLGQNLELVDEYLAGINPEIPALGENFRGLADLADTFEAARPDVIEVLDNLSFLNRSLVDTEGDLSSFLTSTTTSTGELDRLLRENEQRLVTLARDSLPPLRLFEKYSPEFSCLAAGLAKQEILAEKTFGGLQPGLHITVEVTQDQGGYRPGDETVFGEDSGPTCFGLPPGPPIVPFPVTVEPVDGYCDEQERQPGLQNGCDGRADSAQEGGGPGLPGAPGLPGLPGVPAAAARTAPVSVAETDRATMSAVVGPVLGVAPQDVPDLAVLLFGPLARGAQIGLATD